MIDLEIAVFTIDVIDKAISSDPNLKMKVKANE